MQRKPFIQSTTSFAIACCLYVPSLAKCIYGLITYTTHEVSLAFIVLISYCLCIAIGVRCIWLTPSRLEKAMCGLTALSFLFTLISSYVVEPRQYAFTVMAASCWAIATSLLFVRYSVLARTASI